MMHQRLLGLRILECLLEWKCVCPLDQSQHMVNEAGREHTSENRKTHNVFKTYAQTLYISVVGEMVLMPPSEPSKFRQLKGA